MKRIIAFLKADLQKEYENIRFWSIAIFAIGILYCFFTSNFGRIIAIAFTILAIFITMVIVLQIDNKKCKVIIFFKIILKFLLMFLIGLCVAYHQCIKAEKNDFKQGIYDITIDGVIKKIKLTAQDTILTIKVVKAPITSILNRTINIKYNNVETNLLQNKTLNNDDLIRVKTSLSARKYRHFPQDKSYENYAKFFESIAIGKAKSIEVLEKKEKIDNYHYSDIKKNNSFFEKFNTQNKRNAIQQRIYKVNHNSAGAGVVIALLTGNNSFIPQDKLANIRHSGCAHILAISGLHMSIVVSFIFMIFIHFFALFPKLALRYNTKKIAIIPAIFACLFYLRIADVPVSALRSFIMVTIGAIVLLADRPKASLNVLFITFFIMLCMEPNNILSPSFQMSFMAVFGLISIYNNNVIMESSLFSGRRTTFQYVCGILLSSIVATISTVFFEIYHFKQYAWIGLVSNAPVIPLTEFVVLPTGFIGMILNGTFIGDIFYIISGFFANIVCIITDFTANLPYSFLLTKQMSNTQLAIIIAGVVILFLSRAKTLRVIGLSLFAGGFIAYIVEPKVMLVYNQNFKNIVFYENGKYYSVEPIKSDFLHSVWSQNLGVKEITTMTSEENKKMQCYKIDEKKCSNNYCYSITNTNNANSINYYYNNNNNKQSSKQFIKIIDNNNYHFAKKNKKDDIIFHHKYDGKFKNEYCVYTHGENMQIIFASSDFIDLINKRLNNSDYSNNCVCVNCDNKKRKNKKKIYLILKEKYKSDAIAIKIKKNDKIELIGCDNEKSKSRKLI